MVSSVVRIVVMGAVMHTAGNRTTTETGISFWGTMTKMAKKKEVKQAPAVLPVVGIHKINDRAMLVGLTVRRWHPYCTDQKVSKDVAQRNNANSDMGRYRKRLIAKEVFAATRACETKLRVKHHFLTLPWADDGYRILSSTGYFPYIKAINEEIDKFKAEVAKFLPEYPRYREEAKKELNSLFNEADYPSESEIANKFIAYYDIRSIPAGEDIRVDIGVQELKKVQAAADARAEETIKAAIKDIWVRLQEVVSHASERLKAYSVGKDGKVEHTFRDSLITNIIELLDVVPALNVLGDPEITKFADAIRASMTQHPAEVLRDDEKLRVKTAWAADEILAKMSGFLT
jgi:hypothetical protein